MAALLFTGYQTMASRQVVENGNRLDQAQLDAGLQAQMMELDKSFAEQPAVNRYFSGNRMPPRYGDPLRAQVLAMANYVVDFADAAASYTREGSMSEANRVKWAGIMRSYFRESPATRLVWKLYGAPYSSTTACILGAPSDTRRWNWRQDRPAARWPEICPRATK